MKNKINSKIICLCRSRSRHVNGKNLYRLLRPFCSKKSVKELNKYCLSFPTPTQLTTTQRFAPSIWDYPYNKAQESPAPAFAPQTPISPARYSTAVGNPPPPILLNSFFPAVMQLLHYFSGRMQYAELHSTTIAPPFTGGDYAVAGQSGSGLAGTTTPTPFTTTTTRRTPTTTSWLFKIL